MSVPENDRIHGIVGLENPKRDLVIVGVEGDLLQQTQCGTHPLVDLIPSSKKEGIKNKLENSDPGLHTPNQIVNEHPAKKRRGRTNLIHMGATLLDFWKLNRNKERPPREVQNRLREPAQ